MNMQNMCFIILTKSKYASNVHSNKQLVYSWNWSLEMYFLKKNEYIKKKKNPNRIIKNQ